MRATWTAWIVPGLLAASLIYSIYLGFRVTGLERELARSRPAAPAPSKPQPAATATGQAAADVDGSKVTARLESIEDDLADLQENYAALDEQLAGGKGAGTEETKILDVVTKAQARVRDRQLEFHSAQWHTARSAVAEDFGAKNNLERWQIDHIKRLLQEETDEAVELLARPDVAEHPEVIAADWQRYLDETDAEALRVLEGPAAQAWMGARMFERQILWPWLPSLQPAAQQAPN
jgi:hypothetical protein